MSCAAVARSMAAEGCTPDQIAAAVAALETAAERAREARRARLRDGNAERQRRLRERRRLAASQRDRALPPSPLSPPKEASPTPPTENTSPITPSPEESAPARGGRPIPDDFDASPDDRAFGTAEGLTPAEIARTVEDLRLWARARGSLRADWHATLRRFLRRDAAAKPAAAPAAPAIPAPTTIHVKRDTPQGEAWWSFMRKTTGKTPPTDKNGGWRFPSPWPPGWDTPRTQATA